MFEESPTKDTIWNGLDKIGNNINQILTLQADSLKAMEEE